MPSKYMAKRYSHILLFSAFLLGPWAFAKEHFDPSVKTNVNQKTDFLETTVKNHNSWRQDIARWNEEAKGSARSFTDEEMQGLTGKSGAEVKAESARQQQIKADDLNMQGRLAKQEKEADIQNMYINRRDPKLQPLIREINKLAEADNRLRQNLLKNLKEKLKVDCYQAKGNKIQEAQYFVQVEQSPAKELETEYEPKFCEEPQGSYRCTDSVSVTCTKRETRYRQWQEKTFELAGRTILDMGAGNTKKMKKKKFGVYFNGNNEVIIRHIMNAENKQDRKCYRFVAHLGRHGRMDHLFGKTHAHRIFRFRYAFRENYEVCLNWQETWREVCHQNKLATPQVQKKGAR